MNIGFNQTLNFGSKPASTGKIAKKAEKLLIKDPLTSKTPMDVFEKNLRAVDSLPTELIKKIEEAIILILNPVQLKSDSGTAGLKNLVCDTTEIGKTCRKIFNQIVKNSR